MADKTCIIDGGDWEIGLTWGGTAPGVNDKAIIVASTAMPNNPVSDTAIHDIDQTGGTLEASDFLTVSHTIVGAGANMQLKAQTTAAQTITMNGASTLSFSGSVAGDVTLNNTSVIAGGTYNGSVTSAISGANGGGDRGIGGGTFNGTVTANSQTAFGGGTMNGTLKIPSSSTWITTFGALTWGAAATLWYTGAGDAQFLTSTLHGTIKYEGALTIVPTDGNIDIDNTTILGTGSGATSCLLIYPTSSTLGYTFTAASVIVTGPSLTGAFYYESAGLAGSRTVTGFEPLIQQGQGGPIISTRGDGEVYKAPASNKVVNDGVTYGTTDNPLLGTASAGGHSAMRGRRL